MTLHTLRVPVAAVLVFAASAVVGAFGVTLLGPSADDSSHGVHAAWVSNADTVAEQMREADVVVRVQVVDRSAPRAFASPVPNDAKAGAPLLFTDAQVEVLEVYAGDATIGDRFWVLQTGGMSLSPQGEPVELQLVEDPLYGLADELVLFLVDISDDPVHAKGRQLFRTVNPNGRFDVEGSLVSRVVLGTDRHVTSDLASLEGEIEQALRARH